MKWEASWALQAIGSETTIPVLIAALSDTSWRIRWAATRGLGALGAEAREAVPTLASALSDADSRVCEGAAFALESIGPDAASAIPAMIAVLQAMPPDACQVIDAAAAPEEPTTQVIAPGGSISLGDIAALGNTEMMAADSTWTVRWAIVRALGAIDGGSEQTVPALAGVLGDDNWQVRGMAMLSLGRLGYADGVPVLAQALADPNDEVRKAAAVALRLIGPDAHDALAALQAALGDRSETVRDEARKAIEEIART